MPDHRSHRAGAPTVVVVDDAAEVRHLVRSRLRLSGELEVVAEGANGLEAVEAARELQPDLMLLDVSMPQMDGLEALPLVLEAAPGTRVVVYSGFAEQGLAQRAWELGASAFLEKSASFGELAAQLLAVLDAPASESTSAAPADAEGEVPSASANDEAVLREHLERFREVFDVAAIGMASVTLAGRLVRANAAMSTILGRPVTELVGTTYAELAGAAGHEVRRVVEEMLVGTLRLAQVEHTVTTGTGDRIVVATLAPVLDGDERPLYLFVQVQDVTAQRAAEHQLRESEARFRLLVENVEDYAIFMLSPQGIVESWNAGAERINGYGEEEILGRHFRIFYPPEAQEVRHPEHELLLALRDGHYEEEGWRVRQDGSQFWATVLITAVHDHDGRHVGFAKVTRDASERRAMLQEREDAATALADANVRLQRAADDQARFLAVTAHELRTPVSVLAGTADTLRGHWTQLDPEERDELLEGMTGSANRLRRLLADLLTASRLENSELPLSSAPVPLASILDDAVAVARRMHPDTVVELDQGADVVVRGDADRLAQAIDNLLDNAMRHGTAPVRVSSRLRAEERLVEVAVSDSGSGVSPEMRARLFERFATGEGRRGTGLGLYIVRHLARAHGGEVTYRKSSEGHAFCLCLPLPEEVGP